MSSSLAGLGPKPEGDVQAMRAAAAQLTGIAGKLQGARPVKLVGWLSPAATRARAQISSHVRVIDAAGDDVRTASKVLLDAADKAEREQKAWERKKERLEAAELRRKLEDPSWNDHIPHNKI